MDFAIYLVMFFALIALRVPIAFVLFAITIVMVQRNPAILQVVHIQRVIDGTQPFPLLAIPLFILVGELANVSGISRRVLDFASLCTRAMRGGLAQTNIVMSAMLAGMSGSAIGDAAMQAKMLVPEMVRRGYSARFSAVLTASSSLIALMIPPGIGLILFGFVTDISIGRMFMGSIIPGIMIAISLMLLTRFMAARRDYEPPLERASRSELSRAAVLALPVLFLPILIIGGIRGGVFTPSESAAVAVAYAAFLCLIYREARFRDVIAALEATAITTSMIMLVVAASAGLGWVLTFEQVPQKLGTLLLAITDSPTVMLFAIGSLLFISGMFIDGTPLILIFGPMFLPVINALDIDPVHYGVFFVFVVHLGGITPPVGGIMFATCAVTGVSILDFARAVVPFIVTLLSVAGLLIVLPFLTTWLAYL